MKIVQINAFSYKATGSIMFGIHHALLKQGHDSYVVWSRGRAAENDHEICMADDFGVRLHGAYTRITDKTGFASTRATRKLLMRLSEIKPDIIHLHNLHGYYINVEMLFNYIKKKKIKVVWTLHDCWAFTGHCSYFDFIGCDKWKTGCHHCPQKHTYPASKLLDNSAWNWKKKKELFTGLDMTLVTPSNWLADLVRQSFLSEHQVVAIHNGIDLDVFKPTPSDFRKRNRLEDKFIILGVASDWSERKGLADFVKLSEQIQRENYKIVLVGLSKKQIKELPAEILGITRTDSATELAAIYTAADVFFNPTYEDNYPTVNLEAIACGIPVVAYQTGGSPESIAESTGVVIPQGDLDVAGAQFKQMQQGANKKMNVPVMFSKEISVGRYFEVYQEQRRGVE